ncbi:MAG: hypothetical protein IJH50_05535, partial [Kiritimatiellae bacterium]|nr:hypothetical protein [Kiritimatiellia bacterium]
MAFFSRDPREHWPKPHFSKIKVANSGYIKNSALCARDFENPQIQRPAASPRAVPGLYKHTTLRWGKSYAKMMLQGAADAPPLTLVRKVFALFAGDNRVFSVCHASTKHRIT